MKIMKIMTKYILTIFLLISVSCKNDTNKNTAPGDQSKNQAGGKSSDVNNQQGTNDNQEVSANKPTQIITGTNSVKKTSKFWGYGSFIARPFKYSYKGIFFKTYELEMLIGGNVKEESLNIVTSFSVESKKVYNQIKQLDGDKLYIFYYEKKNPIDPEIEETHDMVRSFSELRKGYDGIKYISFKNALTTNIQRIGNYGEGERILSVGLVERWGYNNIVCTVMFLTGGIRSYGGSASLEMNVYSEEGCVFAENALKNRLKVKVKYTEDFWEIWDDASRIISEMTIVE